MDTWVPIVGWEGYYDVSDKGYVRCCPRFVDRAWGIVLWRGGNLKMRKHTNGYSRVQLSKDGVSHDLYVHRLVAEAFIRNDESLPYVNHKNGDKSDNNWLNLEWVTPSQNSEHAFETGLNKRILIDVLDCDSNVVYSGFTIKQLVDIGFQQPAISRCLSGKLKTHKGFNYRIKGNV